MSASLRKRPNCCVAAKRRSVPIATSRITAKSALFDHLVGNGLKRERHGEADRVCSLEVDDELELGRLLDAKVSGFRPFENFVDKSAAWRNWSDLRHVSYRRPGHAPYLRTGPETAV